MSFKTHGSPRRPRPRLRLHPPPRPATGSSPRTGGLLVRATFYGSHGGSAFNAPIVGLTSTPDGKGYWLVASDGGIFSYGDATFYGSHGGSPLNEPIVGMAQTPDGTGYWLVASDGGVFAFGDADFFGSNGGLPLNKPIVGMAISPGARATGSSPPTGVSSLSGSRARRLHGGTANAPSWVWLEPVGAGYWMVAADGGIFGFGDAGFYGSHGGSPLNAPIVGLSSTTDGMGYLLGASDGGVFANRSAVFEGSHGGSPLNKPIVGLAMEGVPQAG